MKMRLRPSNREDGRYVARWPESERQLHMWCKERFTYPLTQEQLASYYDEMEKDQNVFGFTALDEMGTPVGSFLMTVRDWKEESVHMGYIILNPAVRGQGLGCQMVNLGLCYAKDILGMKRATLKVFDSNPAARRCYEKAGFVEEKHAKEDFVFGQEKWGKSFMACSLADPSTAYS